MTETAVCKCGHDLKAHWGDEGQSYCTATPHDSSPCGCLFYEPSPAVPEAQTVPIPEDLRVEYEDLRKIRDGGSQSYGSAKAGTEMEYIERIAAEKLRADRAEATIAEFREMAGELVRIGKRDDWPRWDYWLPKLRAVATGKES